MKTDGEMPCQQCGHGTAITKVYPDPFGQTSAPGRWPTLTLHFECFLAYIGGRKASVRATAGMERDLLHLSGAS
jgi:hypothetical protein